MMTEKKNDMPIIERYRGALFQIGLIIALCLVFFVIEWDKQPAPKTNIESQTTALPEKPAIIPLEKPVENAPLPQPLLLAPYETKVADSNVQMEDEIHYNTSFAPDFSLRRIEIAPKQIPKEEKPKEEKVFNVVEQMPEFKAGGSRTFTDWVKSNIRYPDIAVENGISGTVMVSFTVNSKGEVSDVKVVRSVDPTLDREAVRIVKSSPLWTPGKQGGKNVKVQFQQAVRFVLPN